jgi:hypothetical protein
MYNPTTRVQIPMDSNLWSVYSVHTSLTVFLQSFPSKKKEEVSSWVATGAPVGPVGLE